MRATSPSNPPSRPPSAPRIFASRRPGDNFPSQPISPRTGTSSDQPNSDTFPCRPLARQSLSGSVQWRCIRNGSGDVQVAFHVFRPNHCGYTAKHNAECRIMPSRSWRASIQRGFVNVYSALFCQGSARRLLGLPSRRDVQSSEFLEDASCSQPAWPHNREHSFMRVVRIMPSRRDEKGGGSLDS